MPIATTALPKTASRARPSRSAFARIAASPSRMLLAASTAFVLAIIAHAWSTGRWADPRLTVAVAVVAVSAAVACMRLPTARLAFVALAAVLFGVARFDAALPQSAGASPPRGTAAYVGRLAEAQKVTVKGVTLFMDRVALDGGAASQPGAALAGTFQLLVALPTTAQIGDTLSWQCRIFPPDEEDPWATVVPEWRCAPDAAPTVIARSDGHGFMRAMARYKNAIRATVRRLIPEPDASFVLGLLIGDTGGVPKEIVEDFRSTGTSHVLAVSGYNVSMVTNFAFLFFAACMVSRRRAGEQGEPGDEHRHEHCGAGAPVVRAALMGGVGVAAALVGRRNAGWGPLVLAAALMLAHDPLIIVTDIGFRLSFAAVAGMRAFGAHATRFLTRVPEAFGLRGACAETLSATAATLPIELHDFGTLPVVSLPVNMAIAPLISFSTAMGALALLLGSCWTPLGLPFGLVTATSTGAMRIAAATGHQLAPALHVQASTEQAVMMSVALIGAWIWLACRPPADAADRVRP